ncbi:hypothetical protein BDV95DRAFT_603117 [Massariosphaeria phaeospora]|uniref:BTB domain-containing protein n=1 Tax=Massariosphaeria phaeospora TaxID=100035 RepID=A0A7C8IBZ5_9PLEO|nr:hypothetical protein BDV95DRAFT_603117 [Massariosphaeria phaeospora]
MAAPNFADVIQSPQFTFFIGPEAKAIVVHAAAIAATSPQLNALINGGMAESETRCVKMEHVGVDDFVRFCEYAYRGDYSVPAWEEEVVQVSQEQDQQQQHHEEEAEFPPASSETGEEAVETSHSQAPFPAFGRQAGGSYKKKGKIGWRERCAPEPPSRIQLRALFNSRTYLPADGGPKAAMLQHFEPQANSAADQDFTPVLLAHARLYCFAHLRLITPLKALTLDKLHRTLMAFKLYTARVGDIIALARYAYAHPDLPDRSDSGTLDELRKLVVEYVVCEIDTVGKCDAFCRYLEEGGEFVADFWRLAREYVA